MRRETIAIHGGYVTDPTTKSAVVPIYQTAAYEFDSAEHGAALFNLEAEGFRYSRISNPTVSVLEERVAALEGGVGALCVSSGQAALHFSVLNLCSHGDSLVSVPQLYGTTPPTTSRRRSRNSSMARPRVCSARASAIRPETSATSRRSLQWRVATACRSLSITRWRRQSCCARWSTVPTS
jgi:O-acetylhomoserine (thiol)-lyase